MKTTAAVVGSTILVVAICIGLWFGYWALFLHAGKRAENSRSQINRSSFGFQQTYLEESRKDIRDIRNVDVQIAEVTDLNEKETLQAQRKALINNACEQIAQLNGTSLATADDIQQFKAQECAA